MNSIFLLQHVQYISELLQGGRKENHNVML